MNYEKPVAILLDDLAEGVYAASGASGGDCWSASATSVQSWNGWSHEFEVKVSHNTAVQHISKQFTVVLTFSDIVGEAYASDNVTCTYKGKTVTLTRTAHANAYGNGDLTSFKVWVISTGDQAMTEALSCTSATCTYCEHAENVQGGFD